MATTQHISVHPRGDAYVSSASPFTSTVEVGELTLLATDPDHFDQLAEELRDAAVQMRQAIDEKVPA